MDNTNAAIEEGGKGRGEGRGRSAAVAVAAAAALGVTAAAPMLPILAIHTDASEPTPQFFLLFLLYIFSMSVHAGFLIMAHWWSCGSYDDPNSATAAELGRLDGGAMAVGF